MDSKTLQIALLTYLKHSRPIRGAANHDLFKSVERSQIRKMKDALLLMGLIYEPTPSLKTAMKSYCTSRAGQSYLKTLQGQNL